MSVRGDLISTIGNFCANNNVELDKAVQLLINVLSDAGHSDYYILSDDEQGKEHEILESSLKEIYKFCEQGKKDDERKLKRIAKRILALPISQIELGTMDHCEAYRIIFGENLLDRLTYLLRRYPHEPEGIVACELTQYGWDGSEKWKELRNHYRIQSAIKKED